MSNVNRPVIIDINKPLAIDEARLAEERAMQKRLKGYADARQVARAMSVRTLLLSTVSELGR